MYAIRYDQHELLSELYSDPRWNKEIGDIVNWLGAIRNNTPGVVQAGLHELKLDSIVIEIGLNIAVENGFKDIIRMLRVDSRLSQEYQERLRGILEGSFEKIYGGL